MRSNTSDDTRTSAYHPRQGVKASAGSGKTYGLTSCYLRSLLTGTPPSSLITATFTRKAAGEILSRILSRLADAAKSANSAQALSRDIGLSNLDQEFILQNLQILCRQMHRVSISTIDGLFNRLLQAFALELGHDARVTITDTTSPEATRIAHNAINALLSGDVSNEVAELLDILQDSRLEARVASELHRVLPELYRYYVAVPTNAWVVATPVGEKLPAAQLETAVRCLEEVALTETKRTARAVMELTTLAKSAKWEKLLSNGIARAITSDTPTYYNVPLLEATVDSVRPLVEHAKYCLVQRYNERTQAVLNLLARFHHQFQIEQANERLLFFSDVPRLLAKMLPGDVAQEIEFRLDIVASHLLLDEFQDTDPVQFDILQWFIRQIEARGANYGLLYCVGDLKQSIYGWRGAAPEIFEYLHRSIPSLSWSETSTSYRSSQIVLDAVNRLYTNLPDSLLAEHSRSVADWWRQNYEAHQAARDVPGYVRIEQFHEDFGHETSENDDGSGVTVEVPVGTATRKAALRIAEIARAAPDATVGVLMRTNERVGQMIFQLKELGIPASAEGKSLLTDDPAVLLLMSAVKLADHPGDTASAFHLSVSPLSAYLNIHGAADAFKSSRELRRHLVSEGYATTFLHLASVLAETLDRRSARRLEQLILLADEFDKSKRVRPSEFMQLVNTRLVEDPSFSTVRVMTIHAAKGLEFDIAILPELEKSVESRPVSVIEHNIETMQVTAAMLYPNAAVRSICPQLQSIWEAQKTRDLREALCLLYVAMTRPRHALHILLPAKVAKISLATYIMECLGENRPAVDEPDITVLYEQGEPNWMVTAESRGALVPVPSQPVQSPGDLSGWPKHLMRAERPSASQNYRASLADTLLGVDAHAESLRQGIAIHAMLCLVEWTDTSMPASGEIAAAVRRAISDARPPEMALWQQAFKGALGFPAIADVLRRPVLQPNERIEVWRERQFLEMDGGRLLTGVFDRVVVWIRNNVPVMAHIIDYKTDEIPTSADRSRAVQRHTRQLEIYRTAVTIMLGLANEYVTAKLVFTKTGDVIEL